MVPVIGTHDPNRICTSIIERQNLTMRMQICRLTRLTIGFSKKFENQWAAIRLHFAYYNFCRVHRSLRVTPAMEAGLTDRIWTIAELVKSEAQNLRAVDSSCLESWRSICGIKQYLEMLKEPMPSEDSRKR